MCENAVSTKAFDRREPYPPEKSDAPQRNTAVTEQTAGLNRVKEDTPDEGNTGEEGTCENTGFILQPCINLVKSAGGPTLKRIFVSAILCFVLGCVSFAQTGSDAPASKEDVERYLNAVHSHEMMKQMMAAMSKPMHQMVHEQFMKDKDKLPADFEQRMTKIMDDMTNDMPFDEMLDAMIPAYQKHFTKGDIDALIAFYSAPTGQKMLREMPSIMADAMESMQPIMRRAIDKMTNRVQDEMAEMIKESEQKSANPSPAKN